LELYIVGYVYGLLMIRDAKWTWTFGIITPWLLMVVTPSIANFYDLLLEYVAAFYIFLPMIFINKYIDWSDDKLSPKKAFVTQMLIFGFSIIAGVFLKLFIHTVAGVLWWTPGQWWGSFIFNLPIYGVTLAVALPVSLLVYKPLMKIRTS
jgi:thiamine transporter ThiT